MCMGAGISTQLHKCCSFYRAASSLSFKAHTAHLSLWPWQISLQNRQCHALCTLGKTRKCWLNDFTTNVCLLGCHYAVFSFLKRGRCGIPLFSSLKRLERFMFLVTSRRTRQCPTSVYIGGCKGRLTWAHPTPLAYNFLYFMQLIWKIWQNHMLALPLERWSSLLRWILDPLAERSRGPNWTSLDRSGGDLKGHTDTTKNTT